MMADVLIGADVGGSKTVVAVQADGVEVARVTAPGAAVRAGRVLASSATIVAAVRQALAGAGQLRGRILVVGAAGAGREPEASELARALRGEAVADQVHVTTDLALALAAAFADGPGLVLSAGTGSVVVARADDGTIRRLGGHGWQLGDAGSGYAIGRAALARAARETDGLATGSSLPARLLAAARAPDFDGLVRWAAGAGPREVASLARVVLEAADEGDDAATTIVDQAADALAELTLALSAQSGVRRAALTGGLMGTGALRDAVRARLKQARISVQSGDVDPVTGAFRLAAGF